METTELESARYWESDSIDVRLNPGRHVNAEGLADFLSNELGMRAAVAIATSGSSGEAKWVILSKSAMLSSAHAVNQLCEVTPDDSWYGGLSTFHVGGLAIYARAFLSGSLVIEAEGSEWNGGKDFIRSIVKSGATLTSLTPAHLHDLVKRRAKCPENLRGVFLGGGKISSELLDNARQLGWSLWPSYGMTEAASQIATNLAGESVWLPVLPHWECRVDDDFRLSIRGAGLCLGIATMEGSGWAFAEVTDDEGWFRTGDRAQLRRGEGIELKFLGRADDSIKVLGELISISSLEAVASGGAIVAIPDQRRENELVGVFEGSEAAGQYWVKKLNDSLPAIEHLQRVVCVDKLPRTAIGKLDRVALAGLVERDSN